MIIGLASAGVLKANVSGSLRLGVFLTAAMASLAYGQTILIDDFNDGNIDGWIETRGGTRDPESLRRFVARRQLQLGGSGVAIATNRAER